MNFIKKSYLAALSLLVAGGLFSGCKEEEHTAKAVMASVASLEFDGLTPSQQMITVYSDAEWTSEVPDWVTIEPTSGSGTTDVIVSVSRNIRDGILDNPRKANLVFRGSSLESRAVVIVNQSGMKYRDVPEYTVSQASALEDEAVVIIPDVKVMALCGEGAVLADDEASIFAMMDVSALNIGDVVKIMGDKGTEFDLPVITNVDSLKFTSKTEITYPAPQEISDPDKFEPKTYEYVKVQGLLTERSLAVGYYDSDEKFVVDTSKVMTFNVVSPESSLGLDKMSGHVVIIDGYTAGISKPVINLVAVSAEDKGQAMEMPLYYENWQGQSKNSQKVADWSLTNMIGTGVQGVTYAAGTNCDIRWTYKQGDKDKGYLTYANELFPGYDAYSQGNSAAHLYAGTGTYKADESWVEIRNIKLSGQKALQFGMAIFGVNDYDKETESALPYPVYYKFDNQTDWTLLDNVKFRGNWHWYSLPAFAVPDGAKDVSLRFEPLAANYARVDDCTLVKADPASVPDKPNKYITLISSPNVSLEARGGEFAVKFKTNLQEFKTNLSSIDWIEVKGTEIADGVVTATFTAQPNSSAAVREATLTVSDNDNTVSASVKVSQEGMTIDPFISLSTGNAMSVSPEGGVINVAVQHSVAFETQVNADWIVPVAQSSAFVDKTNLKFSIAANTGDAPRTGTVRFYNTSANLETVLTVEQKPQGAKTVIFKDDFSWLKPLVDEYNAANPDKPIGRSVPDGDYSDGSSTEAPNVYTAAILKDKFGPLFTSHGYEDMCPSEKVLYLQDTYLKLGRTGGHHTSLKLPSISVAEATDCDLSFDWCVQKQTDGVIDECSLTVQIIGDGTFADGTKYSEELTQNQPQGQMFWTHASVSVKGMTSNTRFHIVATRLLDKATGNVDYKKSKGSRWYIDNIEVSKTE